MLTGTASLASSVEDYKTGPVSEFLPSPNPRSRIHSLQTVAFPAYFFLGSEATADAVGAPTFADAFVNDAAATAMVAATVFCTSSNRNLRVSTAVCAAFFAVFFVASSATAYAIAAPTTSVVTTIAPTRKREEPAPRAGGADGSAVDPTDSLLGCEEDDLPALPAAAATELEAEDAVTDDCLASPVVECDRGVPDDIERAD